MPLPIAACGITCNECEAYLATQENDHAKAVKVAEKWSQQFGHAIPVAATVCDGCLAPEGRKGGYCGECPVRACAVERKVATCAHCPDYGCEKIEGFLKMAGPEGGVRLRASLEEIRRSL
jgi:hypothetical protein